MERVSVTEDAYYLCRYTPEETGEYLFEAWSDTRVLESKTMLVEDSGAHGYINVSKKDTRYFEYTDGTPFAWVGINLCFPSFYPCSNGKEFGTSGKLATMGLRQYERWFKKCVANGVNVVRLWIGHYYFSPDTDKTYELDEHFTDGKQYRPISDTVASPRLDCVVAALTNLSREAAQNAVRRSSRRPLAAEICLPSSVSR